jgi:hypothetical protein
LRDAVELEWEGIPTVCIVHRELRDSAAAIARISGHPDYPMITVDYPYIPTATWSDPEIATLARDLAPQVAVMLLQERSERP